MNVTTIDDSKYINHRERMLLEAFINGKYETGILAHLLSGLDIASTNYYYLLALANYAEKFFQKNTDYKEMAWITGILRQTRIRNNMTAAAAKKLLSEMKVKEIPTSEIVFLRDAPMKFYYDPEVTRVMIGLPVLVSSGHFKEFCNIAEKINAETKYHFEKILVYKDRCEHGVQEIHPVCYHCDIGELFFPSPEEYLVTLLHYYVEKEKQSQDGSIIFKAYYDTVILLKNCDFNKLQECIDSSCMSPKEKKMIQAFTESVRYDINSRNK